MLSNTATPIYYGRFRDAVLRKEIPVCQEISMQMNRIDRRIEDPRYYYDDKAIRGFVRFCENELTLTDGTNLKLLESFKLWAEDLFAWFYFEEKSVYVPTKDNHGGTYVKQRIRHRLTRKQFLIVARGAAKSMYSSFIHSYELIINKATTDQIVVAPTMRLAEETLSPIRTALTRARGPVMQFMTEGSINNTTGSKATRVKLASTKKGIENFITGSIVRTLPMSIDKLQGLRPFFSSIDEWLSGAIREDPIGAIEQGAGKMDDYIILATSSEGTARNGVGDTIKMELMKILKNEYIADHVSIWWYKLDDIKEVANPRMWIKANPNLGITVKYDKYQNDVKRAEANPSARNDILAKRFGLPMEGYTFFFTYGETLPHPRRDFWNMPCAMGADMSQGDDFCAFDFMFPLNDFCFGVKCKSYITSRTLMGLPLAARQKYEEFIDEGSLVVMDGTILDMMEVYDDVDRYIIDSGYDVRCFGYDPYNSKEFVDRWERENGPYGIVKVPQGARTESVPLGEIKTLSEDRKLLFDQRLMSFCMGNAITIQDTNGNRKLLKMRREQKIDNVAAMMDAYIAWKANKDLF
jgi:phage terminase large subunit-like protein